MFFRPVRGIACMAALFLVSVPAPYLRNMSGAGWLLQGRRLQLIVTFFSYIPQIFLFACKGRQVILYFKFAREIYHKTSEL
jgi:hypothetical protein